MPKGFKLLLAFSLVVIFFQAILLLSNQASIKLFKFYLPDLIVIPVNLMVLILGLIWIYSLIKRLKLGWKVFLYLNGYIAITTFPNIIYDIWDSHLAGLLSSVLVNGFLIFIQAVIFMYVYNHKGYFKK